MANTMKINGGNRLRWTVWSLAALLWLTPLIAMQFTRDVAWSPFDFAVFGVMLLTAVGAFEMALRLSGNWAYRGAAGLAIVTGFGLVWVNLAVGVIGSERNPANLMFAGVLAIGVIGALISRCQPRGLAYTLLAMALAQGAVAGVALMMGYSILILTALFAGLWLASAWLFRQAAQNQATQI